MCNGWYDVGIGVCNGWYSIGVGVCNGTSFSLEGWYRSSVGIGASNGVIILSSDKTGVL